MTWVKICGITNLEDALVAVEAGADAVGFVFYEKSPRKVDVETARAIVEKLPERVEKVGVFVDGSDTDWSRVLHGIGFTSVQQHLDPWAPGIQGIGVESSASSPKLYVSVPIASLLHDERNVKDLVAVFAQVPKRLPLDAPIPEGVFDTYFLDSGNGQSPGGTGQPFDWRKAVPIAEAMRQNGLKLVVAGGLNPTNVMQAIEVLDPWGVDVSSGVEARPGKKDPAKVRAFVQAVRRAEKSA
jgi:phosphoribosylanthranilate isomerase